MAMTIIGPPIELVRRITPCWRSPLIQAYSRAIDGTRILMHKHLKAKECFLMLRW